MDFYNSLSRSADVHVAYSKDHRLDYDEISHKHLDKLCEYKDVNNVVDIACGPAKTLIYFFLNSGASDMFGSEVSKERYELGVQNILKLQQHLKKDTRSASAKFTERQGHVTLSCSGRILTFAHMSMYDPLVKQKVSEAHVIIANVAYFYRMRHKYKDIFEKIKSPKIISYKGPKVVRDQLILSP